MKNPSREAQPICADCARHAPLVDGYLCAACVEDGEEPQPQHVHGSSPFPSASEEEQRQEERRQSDRRHAEATPHSNANDPNAPQMGASR
jgi:hypothetical protein